MKIILTHENADFDAVASMLGASKLFPEAIPILPKTMSRAVQEFLLLYKNALPFINQTDWKTRKTKVTHIILTDTDSYQTIKGIRPNTPIHIIDHHPLERELKEYETWDGDIIGAASTLVVERLQKRNININSLEATLLALGIYADTGSLTFGGTTTRDVNAVEWLLKQGAALSTIRRFLTLPLTDIQQELFDYLLKSATHRTIQGHSITITSAECQEYIEGIASVTHRLIDIWDSSAIFTIVAMPTKAQLVCRSRVDDIDVSLIAEHFGGGGHPKASAASIRDYDLQQIIDDIWSYLQENIRPAVRVADLMSQGLQLLQANELLQEKLSFIRRVGHEGYPVIDDGRIVGLLTRRDADRAAEHKLKSIKIRDVMIDGQVTLSPDDSVATLEQLMVSSGWGQIPVVNRDGQPIGIVTRTDLINHWASTHPSKNLETPLLQIEYLAEILGHPVAELINTIAEHAQEHGYAIYIVGGVVRDLLLQRKNLDIDFVVEDNAIQFTKGFADKWGGTVHSHKPFGTAKWLLNDTVSDKLNLSLDDIPHHIDFATARFEYYEKPTALPTVYNSSIKLDLQRRDFTINTLAVQLSPRQQMWRILDFYGGMDDLQARLIRVLHSLSFVDDPTRILRAVRFSERLKFIIEPRTAELIHTALPMLKRITGERILNEITLILREDSPERGILKLQALGVFESLHPDFKVTIRLRDLFEKCREHDLPWDTSEQDITRLYWHIMMIDIPAESIEAICDHLGLGRGLTQSMVATSTALHNIDKFADPTIKPSEATQYLDKISPIALHVIWLALEDNSRAKNIIKQYMTNWRDQRPTINGNDLKDMGLKPGPQYKEILDSLRFDWIDEEITSKEEELKQLQKLIAEGELDDDQS